MTQANDIAKRMTNHKTRKYPIHENVCKQTVTQQGTKYPTSQTEQIWRKIF